MAPVDRPQGRVIGLRYTNHRGEEGARQVIITGRLQAGPTEWHPNAAWTFEVWDMRQGIMRWFDPDGVGGGVALVLPYIAAAAAYRDVLLASKLRQAEANATAALDCYKRETREKIRLGMRLADTRRELREALCSAEHLERRRDELLATANRYLERYRRAEAALRLYRRRVGDQHHHGVDQLPAGLPTDIGGQALVEAVLAESIATW